MSRRQYKKPPSNASDAQEAFRKYAEDAADQGKYVENALANSFSAMEGSLVEFVKTGKLNSKSLAESEASSAVAAARLAIRMAWTTCPTTASSRAAQGRRVSPGDSADAGDHGRSVNVTVVNNAGAQVSTIKTTTAT